MASDGDATPTSDIIVLYVDGEGTMIISWDKNIGSLNGTLSLVARAIHAQCPDLHKLLTTNTVEERGITYIDNLVKNRRGVLPRP